ncbi:MAG: hypothetical protein J5950_10265 [Clostridia bacterium]|nr:hypothetical protein [Clostridia bacterium]
MKISEIDQNLRVPETLTLPDVKWFGAGEGKFRLYGAAESGKEGNGPFIRMPSEIAVGVSLNVGGLATNTAGVRLRLRTDSPYVAIHAEWVNTCAFPHMPLSGTSGFDLYRIKDGRQEFAGLYTPPYGIDHGYESVLATPGGMQDLVIYFPLYNDVSKLYIGVSDGARFEEPATYAFDLPVVFYGSSITQGGCASRPANAYQNMLSRALDIDILNLGFSGSALGEDKIAEYIAALPMLAFVCDYDHNAPSEEHLRRTHYPLYKKVREANPDLPIVLLSKPDGRNINRDIYDINLRRSEIVRNTYERAKAAGDENIYYIDGFSLFEEDELQAATVDGCHPGDLGFYYFYKALAPLLRSIISNR